MVKGRKGKIFILSILIIMLAFATLVFCGCEKKAETLGANEALGVLSKINLASSSFSAEVTLKNSELSKINATYLINGENEKFYLKKEKSAGDFTEQTLYKIGGKFYLYENYNGKLFSIANYEYNSLKTVFMEAVYNKNSIILNDAYQQMQIYDYYGFAESLSLVGGAKKGDEVTINASCPTIVDDTLIYVESKFNFNGGKLQSIETSENAEQAYLSSAVRAGVAKLSKSSAIKFNYGITVGEIALPNGSSVGVNKGDATIIYDVSPLKIGGVSQFAVVASYNGGGLSLIGANEVFGLIDSAFNYATLGYEFGGWFSDAGHNELVGNGGDLVAHPQIGTLRLYGKFTKSEGALTATLNYAGANCLEQSLSQIYFKSGSTVADVAKLFNARGFYRLNYYFDGIYTDMAFKNRVDASGAGVVAPTQVLSENIVLYLKFSKNVKIIVDGSQISNQLFRQYYVSKSLLYSVRVKPYKSEGEQFVDYYLEKDYKTPLSSLTDEQIALKGEFTVYPKFAK